MDLSYTADESAFREEARAWLAEHVPSEPLPSFDTEEGFARHRELERILHAGRWSAVSWPEEYGGRGADYIKWLIFEEEYYRAGAPGRVNQNGIFLLGPTIQEVGTEAQKARFLPTMASSGKQK
jgi:alkylation response protein AidB-like acyl-CoA dehydrogenase